MTRQPKPQTGARGGRMEARGGDQAPVDNPFLIESSLVTPLLKVTALENFPLKPTLWNANLFRGSPYAAGVRIEDALRLHSEGTNPFTVMTFGTREDPETHVPLLYVKGVACDFPVSPWAEERMQIRDLQLASLFSKPPQTIHFEARGAFEQFEKLLPEIFIAGYTVNSAELAVTTTDNGRDGEKIGAGLIIDRGGIKLIPSDPQGGPNEALQERLKDWFEGLKAEAAVSFQP